MKRKMRMAVILTAGLLAMAPFAASFTAFAGSTDEYTITVNESADGYQYAAYQIFSGNISTKTEGSGENATTVKVLSDIDWGTGFKGDQFLTALIDDDVFKVTSGETTKNLFADCSDAASVADVLKAEPIRSDKDMLAEFAKLAKANAGAAAGTDTDGKAYEISVTGSGYYLVEETAIPASGESYSRFMLDVVGDAEVKPKRDNPTLVKKIINDNSELDGKANAVSIGDTVHYQIDTTMPDMTGYSRYYYVINDTLEQGLTFNPNSVVVIIKEEGKADKTLNPKTEASGDNYDYEVQTGDAADGKTFQIVFKDFEKRTEKAGSGIVVTYDAILNEKADRTVAGNKNTADLTYSNNPNYVYDTTPDDDEPHGDQPVGTTPKQETKTFTANLVLNKTKADETTKLTGAKFKIEGTSVKATLINGTSYQKVASPTEDGTYYYKMKDGTFSTTKPTSPLPETYDSADAYEKITIDSTHLTYSDVCTEVYVDSNGQIHFGGLGAGTYKITEIVAPEGYNKLTDPIYIEISETIAESSTDLAVPSWTGVQWIGGDGTKPTDTSKLTSLTFAASTEAAPYTDEMAAEFTVINKEGSTLPSTGGIGTKLFYIFGGMLAIGSGVILVTKKRMANTEK